MVTVAFKSVQILSLVYSVGIGDFQTMPLWKFKLFLVLSSWINFSLQPVSLTWLIVINRDGIHKLNLSDLTIFFYQHWNVYIVYIELKMPKNKTQASTLWIGRSFKLRAPTWQIWNCKIYKGELVAKDCQRAAKNDVKIVLKLC